MTPTAPSSGEPQNAATFNQPRRYLCKLTLARLRTPRLARLLHMRLRSRDRMITTSPHVIVAKALR